MTRVFVGTAGWSVPREHAGAFAETGVGLARYASVLGAVETNSTFYRRHRTATFERGAATVPPEFRFAVKVPRAITHEAELASPRRALTELFDDIRGLGGKHGPLRVQLSASAAFDARRAFTFFRVLRSMHAGPVACEPRHPSRRRKAHAIRSCSTKRAMRSMARAVSFAPSAPKSRSIET